ncbi:response regulator transcription factor [Rhodanobacter sp. MP1X3]|uniref:LuxR C-terminal-related transcriptional regulator n=1 Tax=Rhodanobacter sp. MP1X3 TaxID=2723086 RepID=UPI00161CC512|nr:response regulator transcription factor [Rhodanobacter sp. MP1X3]
MAVSEFHGSQHVIVHEDDSTDHPYDTTGAGGTESAPHIVVILAVGHSESTSRELKQALRRHPQSQPLMLALKRDDDDAARLIRSGARGYVAISEPPRAFMTAITAIASGTLFVPLSLQESFAVRYLCPGNDQPESQLTSRELSVLRLLAEGLCNKEVAARLFISVKTVDTHRMNLMRKLGLRTNVDIVRFAIRRELIEL